MRGTRRAGVRLALPAGLLLAALGAAGCGKKGPPQPPLRSVAEPVSGLRLKQVGDRALISFSRPTRRGDDSPVGADAVVEILMTAAEPPPRRPIQIAQDFAAAWEIPAAEWPRYSRGDRLEVGIGLARIAAQLQVEPAALRGRRLSFVVEVVEGPRRRSEPSEIQTLSLCEPPEPPGQAGILNQEEGLLLSWAAPAKASPSSRIVIYRLEEGQSLSMDDAARHVAPPAGGTWLDATALLDRPYRYLVRAAEPDGRCESSSGPELQATRRDLFSPAPPQGLAAVAEGEAIRLFWRPGREPDLAGYRVWRAESPGAGLVALTLEPIVATSYTDRDVKPGVVYTYAVTALDSSRPPNESERSETASEKVEPPR